MRRIFHHYNLWEDFHNDMYNEDKIDRMIRVQKAANILGTPAICEKAMRMVVNNWKYATEFNLSNAEINRRAWLGQAACSIYGNVHEDETREAWGLMTPEQRGRANAIATVIIKEWLRDNDVEERQQMSLFD